MSIVAVTERFQEREAFASIDGERRYVRTFHVQTDSASDDGFDVRDATGIPGLGGAFPNDSRAIVVSKTPKQWTEHPLHWTVTVEYSTRSGIDQEDPEEEDPLLRPPRIEWGFSQGSKVVDFDLDDVPIQNSAREPFDPAPEIDDSRPVLRITRNEADPFDFQKAIDFQDAVNEFPFQGFTAGTAKVALIAASKHYENGVVFWEVLYEIHFRRETWTLSIVDRGYFHLESGVQVQNIVKAKEGSDHVGETAVIQLLNGSGALLSPQTDPPVYRDFRVYETKDFGELDLPDLTA